MQHKKTTGRCVGNMAYGYRPAADGEHVEPEPNEQAALAQILALRSQGRSLRQIAVALNRRHCIPGAARAGGTTMCSASSVTKFPDSGYCHGYCRTVTLTETASHIAACALLPAFDIS
jgi:hypothetical protein